MEKIKIDKERDLIIIEKINEKFNEKFIEKDTKFFCGCCGGIIGVSSKKIKIPFMSDTFVKSLKQKDLKTSILGFYHKSCKHTMFSFKKEYSFIILESYSKHVPQ